MKDFVKDLSLLGYVPMSVGDVLPFSDEVTAMVGQVGWTTQPETQGQYSEGLKPGKHRRENIKPDNEICSTDLFSYKYWY